LEVQLGPSSEQVLLALAAAILSRELPPPVQKIAVNKVLRAREDCPAGAISIEG
jgi:hypothetical protein